jgi:hypothetical protein
MSCRNTDPIRRTWIGWTGRELRHRTGFTDCGTGRHTGRHAEEFNRRFHAICGNWIRNFNSLAVSATGFRVDWIGDIGVTVCNTGFHGEGRAFDLSHIRSTRAGFFIDMNTDWNPNHRCRGLEQTRRYIAVAASLRRYVGTVLTGWYNADHQNHIHFDNGVPVLPIRRDMRTDTTLVQATCKYMGGSPGLDIDGAWGDATERAYRRLLRRLGMQCRRPRANIRDARLFLQLIARNGMAGVGAGRAFPGPC